MRDKQIEEMARAIEQARIKATDTTNSMNYGFGGWYAKELYAAGYRKSTDLAREIFEEIEARLRQLADESKMLRDKEISLGEKTQLNGEWIGVRLALRDIAELKKKYTEGE